MDPTDDQSPRQQGDRPRRQFQSFPQRSTASPNWRMKDDSPRAETQPRQNRGPGGPDRPQQDDGASGSRLYVGNLLYSAQKDDISAFFGENGYNVLNISMSIDPMTGRNPSYCFVDFESVEDANRAMSELNGRDVLGRAVRINPGVARKSGDSSTPRSGTYNRGWQRDGGNDSPTPPATNRWQRDEARPSWNQSIQQTKRLYVGNLPNIDPQSSVEEMMQQLFSEFEVANISKLISPHESKKDEPGNHYYLFVDLANADDVEKAIELLDGAETPWGGNVKVNRAKESKDRKGGREGFGGYQRRGDGRPQNGWRKQDDFAS